MRAPGRALCLLLAVAGCAACNRKPRVVPEVVAVTRTALPADPGDRAWSGAPVHVARLLLQDMVEPRLMAASTPELRVRALASGGQLAFLLEWPDATHDDLPGAARFPDACAVQLPALAGSDLPAQQMGEPGRPVEITFWRASWQAVVDGRGDTIQDLYPGASVDHYPFQAAPAGPPRQQMESRYAPARALGNGMAGPRDRPVEDLVAEGPGTIAPAPNVRSSGRGTRTDQGWRVVIVRPRPAGLQPRARLAVAFAVWEGSRQEAGSRKMRTGWIPLTVEAGS